MKDIQRTAAQVRSEMRFVAAKELPLPGAPMANVYICSLEESIRVFKFRLSGEKRRMIEVHTLIKDLHRLHEDLIHFYGAAPNGHHAEQSAPGDDTTGPPMVLRPVGQLTAMLKGNYS